ncbi:serine threonine-protein kinase [Ceraceosorus bombacis]|uniref:non-specific serine/threonine protein kinase n=1 Tax=Ceraceosorus bombacis TaxID=401625 RepID=A0A0P1BFS4_9BASI|nr:serine threonine-protein kinase [Ceraceosorus bombacis]
MLSSVQLLPMTAQQAHSSTTFTYTNVEVSTTTPGQSPTSASGNMSGLAVPGPSGSSQAPANAVQSEAGASLSTTQTDAMSTSAGQDSNADSGSVMTEDEEDLEDYCKGGYHPVHVGDTFSEDRYLIVRKLGWGHFSTVWLARDSKANRHVALKVVKSAPHYTETALDEIKLLQRLVAANKTHAGRRHCVSLLDHFKHKGPNGSHVCMVFEVLGENLLGLIKRYQHRGVPPHIVKQIAKQVLLGLDYMHRECGIIHTDLKPENVLICIDDVESVVQAELRTNPAAVPTKLVGVPPSQGRGGMQTPRRDGIFITGSQPLPSPSSSLGSSPMFDKWAFGMSRIEKANGSEFGAKSQDSLGPRSADSTSTAPQEHAQSADSIARSMSQMSTSGPQSPSGVAAPTFPHRSVAHPPSQGPSLLSQQAPGLGKASGEKSTIGGSATESATVPQSSSSSSSSTSAMSTDAPAPEAKDPDSTPATSADTRRGEEDGYHPPAVAAGDPNTLPPPPPYDPTTLERITVKIADLGNACWTDHHFTNDIQTRQYRCPEVIIGAKWGPSADMWSAGCMFFELLTGDYLFDPAAGSKYNKDDDHIAQVIELLGDFPKSLAFSGKYSADLFNRRGELRHIHKLRFWPLISVLQEKYLMPFEDANKLSSFLLPMLKLHPDKRASGKDLLDHEWLEGILVEGEFELARRQAMFGPDADVPMTGDVNAHLSLGDDDQDALDALKPISTSLTSSYASSPQAGVHLDPKALQEAQRRAAEHAAQAAQALQDNIQLLLPSRATRPELDKLGADADCCFTFHFSLAPTRLLL